MPNAQRTPSKEKSPGDTSAADGLFKGLAEQIRELERAVSRQEERFQAVMEIGRAIGSTLNLDELLELVMSRVTLLLNAERSTLFLVDEKTGELWSKIAQGEQSREIRLPAGRGVAGWVAQHGQALNLADVYRDDRFNPEIDRITGFMTRCLIAVPLLSKESKVIGVIQALNRADGSFTNDDQLLLEALAGQSAVAIQNAKLYQDTVGQNHDLEQARRSLNAAVGELDVLFDIEKRISASNTLEELLNAIVERAMQLTQSDAGSLLVAAQEDDEASDLYFKAALGEKGEEVKRLTLLSGEGIAGWVAHEGKPVIAQDVLKHKAYDPRVAKRVGYKPQSVLCVPVSLEGRTIGALELLNKRSGEYSDADLRLVTLIAGQAARAITLGKSREAEQRKARLAIIGQMISSVVHDLRTPMTIISGYAQLMTTEDKRDEREKDCEIILKQFETINSMIRETLSFARGEREILLRKVFLNKFIDEVTEYLEKDFAGKGVELKVNANYKGAVRLDENKMKRLIYNIARNAVQAMPDGGKFTLSTDHDEEAKMVIFRFADTGMGIPAEVADKLFQSFVTHGKPGGTGLGLAIVKKIAEEHGGDVTFKSKPGKGTTFTVRIPG
jgi:signal transduction histidine kinase